MRSMPLVAWLSSLSCLSWWTACGGAASPGVERASTEAADLALRHLERTSPHHRHAHRRRPAEPPVPEVSAAGDAGAAAEPTDAGAPEAPAGSGDAGVPPPAPPEPLPRDVVARSALPLHGLAAGALLSEAELWDRLAQAPAVCLGETHDIPAHHYAEMRAIAERAQRRF
jgi:hypothetical protein